ncbi:kinase-associated lipoprotein B [Paenibacillus pasadenensis]|uniref:kinase-associated lipoprotein B n=1 Tax=Paenibacillus pasadenensis TaxID=217090 RepID=UPI00203B6E1D|nr:kinase-associated lipoprotein B [Paenibacillus pasadenensis]MCM3749172.1 kinase-associated lipoprotein B [Paenibacillus pasadenensis]
MTSNDSSPAAESWVRFTYKTGEYAGRLVEEGSPRSVVETLAVLRHPEQGDLHNPYNPDVPFFHERRALAHREKALVPNRDIGPYAAAQLPDYNESREQAVKKSLEELDRLQRWAARASEQLKTVASEYRPS